MSLKNELLAFISWCTIHLLAADLCMRYELQGPLNILARFVWLASGLRSLMHLESCRALALGRDLQSREHSRDLFKLALVYTLAMFLMAAGGLALIM